MEKATKILKQAQTLLFSFSGIIPVICVFCNAIGFLLFMNLVIDGKEPDYIFVFDLFLKQATDISLAGLGCMLALSRNWRFISWVSYCALCLLWIVNTIYIFNAWEADAYFTIFMSIIYVTFVVLSLLKLTNRC